METGRSTSPAAVPRPLAAPARRRPALLTFFAVVAIVIGALKGVGALSSAAAPRLMEAQRTFATRVGAGPENSSAARLQWDTQQKIQDILLRRRAFTQAAAVGSFVVSVGLIAGGLLCLSLRRRGRPLLLASFAAGLLVETVTAWPNIQMQLEIAQANAEMFRRAFQESSGPGTQATPAWLSTFSSAMGSMGTAVSITFIVAFALFFVAGMVYLTRPEVARRFSASA